MKHHSAQRDYWRSLEDLAQTPEVRQLTEHEFAAYDPDGLIKMPEFTRRRFMSLMGASMALAGLTLSGCRRWPQEKLAPYTSNPRDRIPGRPEQYATVMELGGVAIPLLVTSFDGRPIKIEGNPNHPFSQTVKGRYGAADAIAQASLLDLYDPDRSRDFVDRSSGQRQVVDWNSFVGAFKSFPMVDKGGKPSPLTSRDGTGVAVLSEATPSPTTARLKEELLKKFPSIGWFEYEPLSRDNEMDGSILAIGTPVRQMLHLDQAKIILSIDADLLGTHPAHVRYASDWASRRRSVDGEGGANGGVGDMSRVYMAESAFSITGAVADVRQPIKCSKAGAILAAVAANLGIGHESGDTLTQDEKNFVNSAAADLKNNRGHALVAVGSHLDPALHAWGMAINAAIGAIGTTVTLYDEPGGKRPTHVDALAELTQQLKDKKIDTLLILGGNPVYDAPADLGFAAAMKNARVSVHLSQYEDETSQACTWHLPRAHYLEAWRDARAWDGTISVCQPLILPLYDGKTSDQLLAVLAGDADSQSDALVRKTFASMPGTGDSLWQQLLHDGMLAGSQYKPNTTTDIAPPASVIGAAPAAAKAGTYELRFLQDSHVYDGRFAGNGWLQEVPDPLTKLVWDNAAIISKKDADALHLGQGDKLKITFDGRSLEISAYIMAGQPVGVIGLPLGYGRSAAGHIGTDVGFNTYSLRTSAAPFIALGATCASTGNSYQLVTTQNHYLLDPIGLSGLKDRVGDKKYESKEIVRESTLVEFKADPQLFRKNEDGSLSLHQQLYQAPHPYNEPHKWGMSIDMTTCIGCQACVVACQAENNVPIVGKDQAANNRAMHWIRIDRYFKGEDTNPEVVYQPVTCQHCENAPCEQVCPVGATMHDTEGVNVMVYNRCIGTRYCSNNCPYKVRRFNYLDWQSQDPRNDKYPKPYLGLPDQQQLDQVDKIKAMVFNPEVTVRMRGVMEKCTFCIQRIHNTDIARRADGKALEDGDIVTACQQACPTNAIVFGDLNDANSKVSKMHANSRAYSLLGDLDTRPRNRYLAKVSNPTEA